MVAALLVAGVVATGCDGLMGNRHSSSSRDRDAKSGDWTLIGQRSIAFRSDHESIDVGSERRFRAILLAVKGGPVELGNIVVTFGDGTTFSPQVRSEFQDGAESRPIDLPGEARRIQRIDLASRSTSKREGKATIMVYGR